MPLPGQNLRRYITCQISANDMIPYVVNMFTCSPACGLISHWNDVMGAKWCEEHWTCGLTVHENDVTWWKMVWKHSDTHWRLTAPKTLYYVKLNNNIFFLISWSVRLPMQVLLATRTHIDMHTHMHAHTQIHAQTHIPKGSVCSVCSFWENLWFTMS